MQAVEDAYALMRAGVASLKRDILFFDEFLLLRGHQSIRSCREFEGRNKEQWLEFADEVEYLIDSGYIRSKRELISDQSTVSKYPKYVGALRVFQKKSSDLMRYAALGAEYADEAIVQDAWREQNNICDNLMVRAEVVYQREVENVPAVSVQPWQDVGETDVDLVKSSVVIRAALNRVPIPDDMTPWQSIIDLRNDKDVRVRARNLVRWSSQVIRDGLTLKEAEEYLDDLLYEYGRYMAAHKIKTRSGFINTIVVGSAEIIEDIIKLRLSKLASRVFGYAEARADLLMAEMQAPGYEVSIIPTLGERLRNR